MANNYTQGTLSEYVCLTDELIKALGHTGATIEGCGKGYHVCWPEWFQEEEESREENAYDIADKNDGKNYWDTQPFEVLLRAILAVPDNSKITIIQANFADTCSKMRLNEFGGFQISATRNEYLYWHPGTVKEIDGRILNSAEPLEFQIRFKDFIKMKELQEIFM